MDKGTAAFRKAFDDAAAKAWKARRTREQERERMIAVEVDKVVGRLLTSWIDNAVMAKEEEIRIYTVQREDFVGDSKTFADRPSEDALCDGTARRVFHLLDEAGCRPRFVTSNIGTSIVIDTPAEPTPPK